MPGALHRRDTPRRPDGYTDVATPPRPTAAPNAKDENVYDLQAAGGVSEEGLSRDKLQAEVGARVEVTIRPVETVAPAPSTVRKDAGDKPLNSPEPPQRYTVVKINRLAGTCS